MSECIAMAIGFVLGAACVISVMFSVQERGRACGEVYAKQEQRIPSVTSGDSSPCTSRGAFEKEKSEDCELLKRQWENFLNYNGTEYGQLPIGDE